MPGGVTPCGSGVWIRAVTARVAHLAPAATGHAQLTLDPWTEDRRTLEPVIDRANHRWGSGTLRPAVLAPARRRRSVVSAAVVGGQDAAGESPGEPDTAGSARLTEP
ncbi:hypothetical protein ACFQ1I_00670 [Kitasatospora arboriphila]